MPTTTAPTDNERFDLEVLLGVLSDVNSGDLTARRPVHWTGMGGKAADGFSWFPATPQSRTRGS